MIEERQVSLFFVGPDRYCPDCRRLLVHVNSDGTFNLSAKAGMNMAVPFDPDHPDLEWNEEGQLVTPITEAHCELRRCRFRRWLKRSR